MSGHLCPECEEEPVDQEGDICDACYDDVEAQDIADNGELYEQADQEDDDEG